VANRARVGAREDVAKLAGIPIAGELPDLFQGAGVAGPPPARAAPPRWDSRPRQRSRQGAR
jgi:hypothetical protein